VKRGFVPLRHGIEQEGEVQQMASLLREAERDRIQVAYRIVGSLQAVWSWVDLRFECEVVPGPTEGTREYIDELTRWPGFAAAMEAVGWLEAEEGGTRFPGLDEWIGQTQRRRAKDRERKRHTRTTQDFHGNSAGKDGRTSDPPCARAGAGSGLGQRAESPPVSTASEGPPDSAVPTAYVVPGGAPKALTLQRLEIGLWAGPWIDPELRESFERPLRDGEAERLVVAAFRDFEVWMQSNKRQRSGRGVDAAWQSFCRTRRQEAAEIVAEGRPLVWSVLEPDPVGHGLDIVRSGGGAAPMQGVGARNRSRLERVAERIEKSEEEAS